jgi:hypothetical protein
MTRYHIISAPLCSPLRFIINRPVIKKCRWYDGDAGVVRGDDPDVAPSTLRQHDASSPSGAPKHNTPTPTSPGQHTFLD